MNRRTLIVLVSTPAMTLCMGEYVDGVGGSHIGVNVYAGTSVDALTPVTATPSSLYRDDT